MSYEELTSFTDIIEHTFKHTLLAIDIDETMLRLSGEVGTKHWWTSVYNHFMTIHNDHAAADAAAFEKWREHADTCYVEHTDREGLERLLEEARGAGNLVIAVTARSPEMQEITERHLESLGIELSHVDVPQSVCHNSKGVFYVGDTPKSEILMKIRDNLHYSGRTIRRIVFTDDIESTVKNVAETLDASEVVGHCYLAKLT